MMDDFECPIREWRLALTDRGPGEVSVLDLGPPDRPVDVVFLHANGFNAQTYRHILAPLAANYRVLAYDQRGHGLSSLAAEPRGRRNWFDLRDDLVAFLNAVDAQGVILAGHSMGATACLLAAEASAPRAGRVVLFDPVILTPPLVEGPVDSPMIQAALRRRANFASRQEAVDSYRGRGAFRTWPEEILADYVATGLRDGATGGVTLACTPEWEASNYAAHGHDSWAALRSAPMPIDIFAAETGSTFRRDGTLDIAAFAPRVRVETVPGSTHFLPMERPDLVRAALTTAIQFRRSALVRTSDRN